MHQKVATFPTGLLASSTAAVRGLGATGGFKLQIEDRAELGFCER